MSWSITPAIKAASLDTAVDRISAANLPRGITDYILAGLEGLKAKHGDAVLVDIKGQGHLCDEANKDSDGVTSATLEVKQHVE